MKHTRQGNQVMTLHLRVPTYHCQACRRYFRHPFAGIRPRYRTSESYRLEVYEAHHGGVTLRKLSRTHQISAATVERWYQHHLGIRRSEMANRACSRVLGIDEHFLTRKKGYATTLVDLRNHKVFDVRLGRSEPSLRRYLLGLDGRSNVQVVVMDPSETYRSISRRYFPNAIIVADRFHVVRLIKQHFLKLWQQYDPESRKNRGLISLMRRHKWHSRDEQHANLMTYLADYPVLRTLYTAEQDLVLGGVRSGVLANSYFGQVRRFDIRPLSEGKHKLVFVNGSLQQAGQEFYDWSLGCQDFFHDSQRYGIQWESKTLMTLGTTLVSAVRQPILKFMESAVRQSSRRSFSKFNPLNWTDVLLGMINNPWHNAMAKSGMTGLLLAEILSRAKSDAYTLMGHSIGTRVLFYTLLNVSMKRGSTVKDVYLLGGAVDRSDKKEWLKVTVAVSGKIYNCYSKNDGVPKYLYQGTNALLSSPIGYRPIEPDHRKIVNIDCTDIVNSHMEYKTKLPPILKRTRRRILGFNVG